MSISKFLDLAQLGRVRIALSDGQVHTGHFRTDILSENAISAFFFGDARPLSLSISEVVTIEALPTESRAA